MALITVDQSIKVEDTRYDTKIAVVKDNDSCLVILTNKLKRAIYREYTKFRKPKLSQKQITFALFAYGIAKGVREIFKRKDVMEIDDEYSGRDYIISSRLQFYLLKFGIKIPLSEIQMTKIGKIHLAHKLSREEQKPKRKIILSHKNIKTVLKELGLG